MSETDAYYLFVKDRVLLLTSQIYRPTAPACWVYLTAQQVEMLRNMTQYLNRPNTYVEEYAGHRYLTPDAEQFDGIQAIVADLEEKLMGNPNVLWGYTDRIVEQVLVADATAGINYVVLPAVPAGEVWVIEGMAGVDVDSAPSGVMFGVYDGSTWMWLEEVVTPAANVYNEWKGVLRLKEDDICGMIFSGCVLNDNLVANFWGYKMVVP